jgi:hypothetical protein
MEACVWLSGGRRCIGVGDRRKGRGPQVANGSRDNDHGMGRRCRAGEQSSPSRFREGCFRGNQEGSPERDGSTKGRSRAPFTSWQGLGKKRTVRRRKPSRILAGDGGPEAIMRAGLHFIHLSGGVEAARERLVGLEELIDVAKGAD